MRSSSSRRAVVFTLMAAGALSLGGCMAPATSGDMSGSSGLIAGAGGFGAAPLVDTAGRPWAPTVERSFVSALGQNCAAVALTPLSGGLPIHRVVCEQGGQWVVTVPLVLAPGEADPRFASVPAKGADATPSVPAGAISSPRSPS